MQLQSVINNSSHLLSVRGQGADLSAPFFIVDLHPRFSYNLLMIYEIIRYPNKELKEKSKPVTADELQSPEFQALLDDMLETMKANNGVGLAAPQIGIKKRIIVIDIPELVTEPAFLINPELKFPSRDKIVMEEGCLSIPNVFANVKRKGAVELTALNRKGGEINYNVIGFLAGCLQHECDHLDGKLFVDRLGFFERKRVLKNYKG